MWISFRRALHVILCFWPLRCTFINHPLTFWCFSGPLERSFTLPWLWRAKQIAAAFALACLFDLLLCNSVASRDYTHMFTNTTHTLQVRRQGPDRHCPGGSWQLRLQLTGNWLRDATNVGDSFYLFEQCKTLQRWSQHIQTLYTPWIGWGWSEHLQKTREIDSKNI